MKEIPTFGNDPMDVYSKPIGSEKTSLGELFEMPVRRKVEKPGRELSVVWDERIPLIDDFKNRYQYTVKFIEEGNFAGNHFHNKKQELFKVLIGEVKVLLEDPKTKESETIILKAEENKFLYVPAGIAHKVVAEKIPSILFVNATYPNNEEDEFNYEVI